MKRFLLSLCAPALILFTASCSGGAGKFTGKWRQVERGESAKLFVIEEKGDKYDFYPEANPGNFMPMTYDEDHDMLTLERDNMVLDIKYNKDTKHLTAGPRGQDDDMEFEKVD